MEIVIQIQHITCIVFTVNDELMISPVEVTIPHKDDKIMIAFGSSLKTDPCLASYAVDDIMIYVK